MEEITLNLLVEQVMIRQKPPRFARKLPITVRRWLTKAWKVGNIYAMGLPGQPLDVCTNRKPNLNAAPRTISLPTEQAHQLHAFFTAHYVADPEDVVWTSVELLQAMLGAKELVADDHGGSLDAKDLKPGAAYVAMDKGGGGRAFLILPDEPGLCLTIGYARGIIIVASVKAVIQGKRARVIYQMHDKDTLQHEQ